MITFRSPALFSGVITLPYLFCRKTAPPTRSVVVWPFRTTSDAPLFTRGPVLLADREEDAGAEVAGACCTVAEISDALEASYHNAQ